MSKKLQRLFVIDILNAIADIEEFCKDQSFEQFSADKKTQAAVIQKLTVIGEASNRISKELRDKHPEVEWNRIIRSRHILVHEYDMINLEVIWRVYQVYLPELKRSLDRILHSSPNEFWIRHYRSRRQGNPH